MKTIVNHTWIPAPNRTWHHFTVTRMRDGRGDTVRVAYCRTNSAAEQLHTNVDVDVDVTAERYLSPDAIQAWREQRAHGWDGTAASYTEMGAR